MGSNGDTLVTSIRYDKHDYEIANGAAEIRKTDAVTTSRTNGKNVLETEKEQYTYPIKDQNFVKDFFFPLTKTEKFWNGQRIRTNNVYYSNRLFRNGKHMVPKSETQVIGSSQPYTGNGQIGYTIVTYNDYSPTGELTKFTIPGMEPTYLTWDVYGRLTSKKTGTLTTKYSYKSESLLVGIENPSGYIVRYGYDTFGRLAQIRDTLGIRQKIRYNYRNHPFVESNPNDQPQEPDTTNIPAPIREKVDKDCTISIYAALPKTATQKQFEIKWQQNVNITLKITTQRQSTSIIAGINKITSNGTDIYDTFTSSGKDNPTNKTYSVNLAPGTYQIAVQMPHYDNDTSTRAYISVKYQTYN